MAVAVIAVAVIAVAVMLVPVLVLLVLVFVLVLLVPVFLVLVLVAATKATSENFRHSHFLLSLILHLGLFPARRSMCPPCSTKQPGKRQHTSKSALRLRAIAQKDVVDANVLQELLAIGLYPRQWMLASPGPATAQSWDPLPRLALTPLDRSRGPY